MGLVVAHGLVAGVLHLVEIGHDRQRPTVVGVDRVVFVGDRHTFLRVVLALVAQPHAVQDLVQDGLVGVAVRAAEIGPAAVPAGRDVDHAVVDRAGRPEMGVVRSEGPLVPLVGIYVVDEEEIDVILVRGGAAEVDAQDLAQVVEGVIHQKAPRQFNPVRILVTVPAAVKAVVVVMEYPAVVSDARGAQVELLGAGIAALQVGRERVDRARRGRRLGSAARAARAGPVQGSAAHGAGTAAGAEILAARGEAGLDPEILARARHRQKRDPDRRLAGELGPVGQAAVGRDGLGGDGGGQRAVIGVEGGERALPALGLGQDLVAALGRALEAQRLEIIENGETVFRGKSAVMGHFSKPYAKCDTKTA